MATRPRRDKLARIVDAALRLAGERDWATVTLDDIAAEAKLDRNEVYRLTPTKAAVLGAFVRRVDLAVLADTAPAGDETAAAATHDRLFDVLMRRFEVLRPERAALAKLTRSLPRDPAGLLALVPQAHASFAQMLQAAGVSTAGVRGLARIHAVAAVWLATQRTWFADDSPDMARTMAALDRNLRRMEASVGGFVGLRGRAQASAD